MNWYDTRVLECKILSTAILRLHIGSKQGKPSTIKLAYMSKGHTVEFNDRDTSDGYRCKMQLTESKKGIVLVANFLSEIYSFPLFSETWNYPKIEVKRAMRTFNRCVNLVEDMKLDVEDDDIPGPTIQGVARETFRFVDIDRKKTMPSRTLEAAKYETGETDWRSSIYGNRLPSQQQISITNHGNINISP